MVYGNIVGVLIVFVIDGCGFGVIFDDFGFDDLVDFVCGLIREYMVCDFVENMCGDLVCVMYVCEICFLVDCDIVVCFVCFEDYKGVLKVFVVFYLGFFDGKD